MGFVGVGFVGVGFIGVGLVRVGLVGIRFDMEWVCCVGLTSMIGNIEMRGYME